MALAVVVLVAILVPVELVDKEVVNLMVLLDLVALAVVAELAGMLCL
jgi:hypothetical protein